MERWWDALEGDFPLADEPDAERSAIVVGGAAVGMVQWSEELEPKYRSASIDIFVSATHHGLGVGTAAVRLAVEALCARGHHRITIDPAAENAAAIRCYEKAGFARVGRMRLAERDADGRGWHDVLLMELVVEPDPE